MHGTFDGEEFGRAILEAIDRRCSALETKIARLEAALEARAIPKYLGVYKPGATYSEGSMVTRDGSIFHANKPTREAPGNGSQDWVLCVKRGERGRDGKDAKT